ncbi:MAG: hypothetical protein JNK50_15645 [Bacteroidia bacterium]|nr:hypothetical protein [Bacteroidia bacterium]
MTILDKAKNYYRTNSPDLDSFLETTSFMDTSTKYPNSVVIKFGVNKLIGEVSVWQNDYESYIESESLDLTNPDKEMVCSYKAVNSDTVVDELTKQFDALRKLCGANNL